jgi:putative tricarboxylic transport membrane protein
MSVVALGLSFLLFSAVSIWDGLRIAGSVRLRGTLDLIGPDRYLLGVGVLLAVVGLLLLVQGILMMRKPQAAGATPAGDDGGGYVHFALIGILLAYAMLLPIAGYLITTLAFFLVTYRVMGMERWGVNILSSLASTALFWAAFTILADLPLPKGLLDIG